MKKSPTMLLDELHLQILGKDAYLYAALRKRAKKNGRQIEDECLYVLRQAMSEGFLTVR
jgi:plasmid stability protein